MGTTAETSAPPRSQTLALCPSFLAAMNMLGKRWNGMIVQVLGQQPLRFSDLRRSVPGITDAVLSRRLNELQTCRLVEREDDSPRAPYRLTTKGAELVPVLDDLTAWGERWDVAGTHGTTP